MYVGDYAEGGGAGNRVSKFEASGRLVSTWGEGGEIVGAGAKSPFGPIKGIAVDPSGNLWVATSADTFEFSPEALLPPSAEWHTPGSFLPYGVAVDSHDNLYLTGGRRVSEMTRSGVEVGLVTEPGEEAHPIETYATDVDSSTDDLYVLDEPGGYTPQRVQLQRYEPGCVVPSKPKAGCTAAETFTSSHLTAESAEAHGLAVNPGEAKTVYVTSFETGLVQSFSVVTVPGVKTSVPSGVSAAGATLEGLVDPSTVALTQCFFEYGETAAYGHRVSCEDPGAGEVPVDSGEHAVHAAIPVVAGRTYHYRLVAENANDEQEPSQGADVAFGPPLLSGESSVEVSATTASLQAGVDPQSVDTRVRVEYGTSTEYGEKTGELDIGAGSAGQAVPIELAGLAPGTTYHYRFVAENVLGEGAGAVVGPDRVFTTQGAGSFRLPDGREWELVSPRDRNGASIEPLASSYDAGGEIQASSAGGAVSYVTNIPFAGEPVGFPEFAQALSTRGPSGWVSRDLSVPHNGQIQTGVAFNPGREYRYFSEDLSEAAVQPAGVFEPCQSALGVSQPCVSPEASEQTATLQDLSSGVFTPLVTGCPSPTVEEEGHPCPAAVAEHANVPAGTVFGHTSGLSGGELLCPPIVYCGPFFEDATPDLSHVVVSSPVPLGEAQGAPVPAPKAGTSMSPPPGNSRSSVTGTSARSVNRAPPMTGMRFPRMAHACSGQRPGRPATCLCATRLPENPCSSMSPKKDVSRKADARAGRSALEFQDASANGERVFFTDTQQLTTSSGAGNEKPDLYECRIEEVAGKPACTLTDLTPANGTESAGVQGVIPGASEDGATVYFVANGVLGDGAQHGAVAGDCVVKRQPRRGRPATCTCCVKAP